MRRKLGPGAGEQLDVADDLDAGLAGALRDRVAIEREAGGDDEAVELAEVRFIEVCDFRSPAKAGVQAAAKQRFPLPWAPAFAGEQFIVPRGDPRAAGKQRLRRRQPGPRQTVDRIMLAGECPGGDHRSLRVDRPASARMKLTIQKRMTTVGSDHPRCSKWWWIGAIRKTRLPVRL